MSKTEFAASPPPTAAWKRAFQKNLRAWFDKARRDLPWRRSRDPYRVWLSEIMLQQTQVATVIPYFERFLAAFPTVDKLAAAEEREVFRLWEGLGYYRRAGQLHRAAQVIVAEHGGLFPRTFDEIYSLPGIGRYTAGAVASIAYDLPTPILEANTVRLFCRLLGFRDDPTTTAAQRRLWEFAEQILPTSDVGLFNQALMELGALVCTPRQPKCETCPVRKQCMAYAEGLQQQIPSVTRKLKFTDAREAAVVVWRGNQVLLRERPHGERWAGLWDFVRFSLVAPNGKEQARELQAKTFEQVGIRIDPGEKLTTLKHGVTRFRITLECFAAKHVSGTAKQHDGAKLRWVKPTDLHEYPLSTTGRKLAKLIADK